MIIELIFNVKKVDSLCEENVDRMNKLRWAISHEINRVNWIR